MDGVSRQFSGADEPFSVIKDFSDALQSQNMYRNSLAHRTSVNLRELGAVPLDEATAFSPYASVRDELMINPKLPKIAKHPVMVLKNSLDDFRDQLGDNPAYNYLRTAAENYSQNIIDILSIPAYHKDYYNYTLMGANRNRDVDWAKKRIDFAYDIAQEIPPLNAAYNLNFIEGQHIDAPRKGVPSLVSMAAVQTARLKNSGEDFEVWQEHPEYGNVIDKSLNNVGTTQQQIARFVDYVQSDALTPQQRESTLSQLNAYFRSFLRHSSPFTWEELAVSPDRLVNALKSDKISFMGFMLEFQHKYRGNTPLKNYHATATFEDIQNNIKESDAAKNMLERLEIVPREQRNALVDDFARIVEPLRQKFKQDNPYY